MNRQTARLLKLSTISLLIALLSAALTNGNMAHAQTAALPAQKSTVASAAAPKPARVSASNGITAGDVLSMVQAGLSDDLIVAKLRKEGRAMDLSANDLITLKKANVSETVIRVMMDPDSAVRATPVPVAAPAPLIATLPVVNPSGATPIAASAAPTDPNDPLTAHDSGIYLYTKDRDGKAEMTVLERAAYQGSKTGGIFTSALTYGIKKIKSRAVIPGPRASIRTPDQTPVFYFYFDDKAAGLGKSYFGVNNLSNPNQFALLKLEVTKSNRETVIGQVGAFSASSGTDAKALVTFKSERVRPGLYKVVVDGLQSGEYCFLASSGALGAYGAGAAGAVDIFDFGFAN